MLPVRGDDGVLDEEFASFYLGHLERIRENRGRVVDWWDELVEGSVPVTEYKVAEPAETGAVLSRDDITSRNKMLPFCDHLVKVRDRSLRGARRDLSKPQKILIVSRRTRRRGCLGRSRS